MTPPVRAAAFRSGRSRARARPARMVGFGIAVRIAHLCRGRGRHPPTDVMIDVECAGVLVREERHAALRERSSALSADERSRRVIVLSPSAPPPEPCDGSCRSGTKSHACARPARASCFSGSAQHEQHIEGENVWSSLVSTE